MRRLGIVVLVVGLAGFGMATQERRGYDTIGGKVRVALSTDERGKRDTWETLRWISLGIGVFGAVLILFPGKKKA